MQKIAIDSLPYIHYFDLLPKPQCHPAYRRILNAGYPAYRLVQNIKLTVEQLAISYL